MRNWNLLQVTFSLPPYPKRPINSQSGATLQSRVFGIAVPFHITGATLPESSKALPDRRQMLFLFNPPIKERWQACAGHAERAVDGCVYVHAGVAYSSNYSWPGSFGPRVSGPLWGFRRVPLCSVLRAWAQTAISSTWRFDGAAVNNSVIHLNTNALAQWLWARCCRTVATQSFVCLCCRVDFAQGLGMG